MNDPVTIVDLARYDTAERRSRAAARPSRRWRVRTGAVLESWGRRLRAGARPGSGRVAGLTAARVTAAGAR